MLVENQGAEVETENQDQDAGMPGTGATMVPGPNSGENKQSNAEKAIAKRAFKVKYGDSEETIELDDKQQQDWINKAHGADKKFQEAAQMRKQASEEMQRAQSLVKQLRENPRKVLQDPNIGVNLRKFAEEYLAEELEREMMDPDKRELMELRAREQERTQREDEERREREEQETRSQKEQRIALAKDNIAKQIGEVLKTAKFPQTPRTVAKIAAYIEGCKRQDIPYTMQSIIDHVQGDYQDDFKHLYSSAEPETLAKLLGEEIIQKIRKWDNERVMGKKATPQTQKTEDARPQEKAEETWRTIEEDSLGRFGTLYPYVNNDD